MVKPFITIALLLCTLSTFAIQVRVIAHFKDCAVLGLNVNGHGHGGLGHEYSNNDLPRAAHYGFGYRKSLFGDDITCYTPGKHPSKTRKLMRYTTIILTDKNGHCTQWVARKKEATTSLKPRNSDQGH
jgi:hypothetical protein